MTDPAASASLRISRAHYPVTVLGPGRRAGIWVQGCGIGCRNCISRDTWDSAGGQLKSVATLVTWCQQMAIAGLDGITISGGEPFEQAASLAILLEELGNWRRREGLSFDILCYSGLPLFRLRRDHGDILAMLDAIIPEPFVHTREVGATWQGSDNQPLVPLSSLGRDRYRPFIDGSAAIEPALQFDIRNRSIWFIGIPGRGDMDRLTVLLGDKGLEIEDMSWT